jgi:hypothetical protein
MLTDRKPRMKGRVIMLMVTSPKRLEKNPQKFFVGSSAAEIARKAGFYGDTISIACKEAEGNENHICERKAYTVWVGTFIKGRSHNGRFGF